MDSLAISAGAAALFFLLGLGPSLLLLPEGLRRRAFLLAPAVGLAYLAPAGWILHGLHPGGTDHYFGYLLAVPAGCAALAVALSRRGAMDLRACASRDQAPALLGAVAVFLFAAWPLLRRPEGPTTLSLGNNDVALYAVESQFLKEHGRGAEEGFASRAPEFSGLFRIGLFGGPLATAVAASALGRPVHEVGSLLQAVWFSFGSLLVWILARDFFRYGPLPALAVTLAVHLNPFLLYVLHHGFQGQVLAAPLALSLLLLHLEALRGGAPFMRPRRILGSALVHAALALTYFPLLFLFLGFLGLWAAALSVRDRTPARFLAWAGLAVIGFVFTALIAPRTVPRAFTRATEIASGDFGWWLPMPRAEEIFALADPGPFLFSRRERPLPGFPSALAAALAILVALAGLRRASREGGEAALLAACALFFLVSGWCWYSHEGRRSGAWGGYRAFKFLTYFLPLLFPAALLWFRSLPSPFWQPRGLAAILPLALLVAGACRAGRAVTREAERPEKRLAVGRALAGLRTLEEDPRIPSVNLLRDSPWTNLFQIHFLMRKDLFLQDRVYGVFPPSPLRGEWDLVRSGPRAVMDGDAVRVNRAFFLKRAKGFSLGDYAGEARGPPPPTPFPAGRVVETSLRLRNGGRAVWLPAGQAAGRYPVCVVVAWKSQGPGDPSLPETFQKIPLLFPIRPGETARHPVRLDVPPRSGTYLLRVEIVLEGVAPFAEGTLGRPGGTVRVQ